MGINLELLTIRTIIVRVTIYLYNIRDFFNVDHFLKVFIEFITMLLLFYVWVLLATRPVSSYLPDQGSNLHLPELESKVKAFRPQRSP